MENDALAAGVSRIGGLFGTADIRILICYIIRRACSRQTVSRYFAL